MNAVTEATPKFLLTLLLAFALAPVAGAQELAFATLPEAQKTLSNRDAFVERMSPFDRAARMKTDRDISQAQYLEFAASAALEWTAEETSKVQAAFDKVRPAIAQLSLPLPARISVIKTSGLEEGNAAYTRGNAIVLPKDTIASPQRDLQRLLAHESFHIASRHHPKLARALYATIGFRPCDEVELPPQLASRKITNPDAPRNDHCIDLTLGQEKVAAVPILLSRSAKYDVSRGGEFFNYLELAFLLVERGERGLTLVGLQEVSGFFEQVGQNTRYIIHPEEILADNFALLVLGEREVRSPDVLSRIRAALLAEKP
jgi:hypothetical protein